MSPLRQPVSASQAPSSSAGRSGVRTMRRRRKALLDDLREADAPLDLGRQARGLRRQQQRVAARRAGHARQQQARRCGRRRDCRRR